MEIVEDLGAKVYKCSYINVNMVIFSNRDKGRIISVIV